NGYFKVQMPENHVIEGLDWNNTEEFIETLTPRSKKHFKQDVLRHEEKFELKIHTNPTRKDIKQWYQLYLNVKDKSLALNTFTIPFKVFENMAETENWDIQSLSLKPEYTNQNDPSPVAVMFSYVTNDTYNFTLVGIDYERNKEFSCYRQSIYRVLTRAKELGLTKVRLGFSATVEKRKFGATVSCPAAYIQAKDNFNMELLGSMSVLEKHTAS
ncbi:MAG: GNAT family N-acetyltransferase, partial [Flavobacteriales bacterium]|nr:GNAT family N-acetyltransferase [Flavobacteriales bacterium]